VHATPACDGAPRAPYVDVLDRDTHADGIDCLHGLQVILGRDVDAFEPRHTLRRDQMASIVARAIRASGTTLPGGSPDAFDDVTGSPHREAIESLEAAGIVFGRASGRYEPAGAVPRGQMTAFLVRAHDHVLGERGARSHGFSDVGGHPHEDTIARAADLGLAAGRTRTEFRPQELTQRDQTATFLSRLLGLAVERGEMDAPTWGHTSRTRPLPATLRRTMTGVSWRTGCPVGLDDLRLVETVHRGFDGRDRWGLLVVHRDAANAVTGALTDAYRDGFAIQRMRLIDRYGADDDRSMAANNSSAFNCRRIGGGTSWSEHAYGRALDLNPVQNPFVVGATVAPTEGRAYLDRSDVRRGMVVEGGAVVRAFDARGWGWGGRWRNSKDYQHFSATGR
jgi:hypothetical protein